MKLTEIEIYQKLASKEISYNEAKESLELIHQSIEKTEQVDEKGIDDIQEVVIDVISKLLHTDKSELNVKANLKDLGVDSINAAEIVYEMNKVFGTNLDTTVIYDYVTIEAISNHLIDLKIKKISRVIVNEEKATERQNDLVRQEEENKVSDEEKLNKIKKELIEIVGDLLHVEAENINVNSNFQELGIDSINGVEIVKAINDKYKINLDTVMLYDYSTIHNLSKYVLEEVQKHSKIISIKNVEYFESEKSEEKIEKKQPLNVKAKQIASDSGVIGNFDSNRIVLKKKQVSEGKVEPTITPETIQMSITSEETNDECEIAVIGMACKYPHTKNVEEFWNNLKDKKSCIDKVPEDRWVGEDNAISYYGGFVDDIDKFDPLFFHITPMEAELMDPQQRIFMQQAYAALEDAGYSERALSKMKCGVYVGATQGDYANVLKKSNQYNTMYAFTGLNTFILTGRLSYYLDLVGPNMSIDTACSSSLVAIKQACDSIKLNECDMAVAGGVRLMVTSDLHEQLEQLGMLAADGKCRAFDQNATGMVLGEGAGVVVLKKLDQALRDGDHIYGVIKKYAVNQDGKTNGMISPSAQSQFELENQVYDEMNLNPESIGYIEASCTGTRMGDAIELKALNKIFKKYTSNEKYCAIGSVKANIGHTTMASGVASVIKVLLSMKHKQLIPQINYEQLNTEIDLTHSPFYVNTEIKEWEAKDKQPRRAAVSSFGISGTNCHMVFEENLQTSRKSKREFPYYLVVLSANTKGALERKKDDFKKWLRHTGINEKISNIAYTLLNGRSFFKERAVYIVQNTYELLQKLETNNEIEKDNNSKTTILGNQLIEEILCYKDDKIEFLHQLESVAGYFIDEYDLKWDDLYQNCGFCKLSMPTYPFEEGSYWASSDSEVVVKKTECSCSYLHPMIHRNASTVYEQKFYSVFTREESFLRDHLINGKMVLPAVSYIEMARAAGSLSLDKEVTSIKDIIWSSPFVLDNEKKEIKVAIYPSEDLLEFEISSESKSNIENYCQGRIVIEPEEAVEQIEKHSIDELINKCNKSIDGDIFYSTFLGEALWLGETMHSIQKINYSKQEALSELEIHRVGQEMKEDYILNPSLIDGIVESTIVLIKEIDFKQNSVYMPFALEKLTIIDEIPNRCFAYLRYDDSQKYKQGDYMFDIDLINPQGDIVARFKRLWIREMPAHNDEKVDTNKEEGRNEIVSILNRLVKGDIEIDKVANYIGGLLDEK